MRIADANAKSAATGHVHRRRGFGCIGIIHSYYNKVNDAPNEQTHSPIKQELHQQAAEDSFEALMRISTRIRRAEISQPGLSICSPQPETQSHRASTPHQTSPRVGRQRQKTQNNTRSLQTEEETVPGRKPPHQQSFWSPAEQPPCRGHRDHRLLSTLQGRRRLLGRSSTHRMLFVLLRPHHSCHVNSL